MLNMQSQCPSSEASFEPYNELLEIVRYTFFVIPSNVVNQFNQAYIFSARISNLLTSHDFNGQYFLRFRRINETFLFNV